MSIGCGPQYVINVLSQIVLLSPCVTQLNCQTQCDGFQAQGLKVLSTVYKTYCRTTVFILNPFLNSL